MDVNELLFILLIEGEDDGFFMKAGKLLSFSSSYNKTKMSHFAFLIIIVLYLKKMMGV